MHKIFPMLGLLICFQSQAQIVNIPDANFKAWLLAETEINTNGDSEIQQSEAIAFDGDMSCNGQDITDFTGLEEFVNLESLDITINTVATLDISTLGALRSLQSEGTQTSNIIFPVPNQLERVWLGFNNFTSFDATILPNLESLRLADNPITTLDMSTNAALEELFVEQTQLSALDLSGTPALRSLWAGSTLIENIDLSGVPLLENLLLTFNTMAELDLSAVPALEWLRLGGVQGMSDLDLSSNPMIDNVSLPSSCTYVDLRSGSSADITTLEFWPQAQGCIQVDEDFDLGNIPAGWSFGELASVNTDCTLPPTVTFGDSSLLQCILATTDMDTNADGQIQVSEAEVYTGTIDCADMGITTLDGLGLAPQISGLDFSDNEVQFFDTDLFPVLTYLRAANNNLQFSMYLPENPLLTEVDFSNNAITNFSVQSCDSIVSIDVSNTMIDFLGVTNKDALQSVNAGGCPFADGVNLAWNNALTFVNLDASSLASLDVSNLPALETLYIYQTDISTLDLSQNPALLDLNAQFSDLNTIDVANNLNLKTLNVTETNISAVDVSANVNLEHLYVSGNALTSLDVANNPLLKFLICDQNSLDSLDLSAHPDLTFFEAFDNSLVSLNLASGNNIGIIGAMDVTGNPDLSCIQVDETIDLLAPPEIWNFDETASFSLKCTGDVRIDETDALAAVSLYPNPASAQLNIQTQSTVQLVEIIAPSGKIVSRTANNATLNIADLASGIYFAKIYTPQKTQTIRFAKQ